MHVRDSSAGTLKRSSVVGVLALTVITLGVYVPIWYLRRRKGLNSLASSTKLGVKGPVFLLMLGAILLALPMDSRAGRSVGEAVWLTSFALAIKVRWMLAEHLRMRTSAVLPSSMGLQTDAEPSRLLTFLFTHLYLQYRINQCIEMTEAWTDTAAAA